MALKNRDAQKQYLKVKDGKFYVGKEDTTGYEELEGQITDIRFKDEEYEGVRSRKCYFTISDGDTNYALGLNVESSNYTTLVSFLNSVDITQPLTLHPKQEKKMREGKEISRNSILVSQDGKYAKGYFTKDEKHGLPEWKTVKVGSKSITDKSETSAFLEDFVNENYTNKINRAAPVIEQETESRVAVASANDDKMPWDD